MQYSFVNNNGHRSVSVFANGEVYVATDAHPNFDTILAGAAIEDESILNLFDVSKVAAERFERVSQNGRVTVANGNVYFDGDVVDNSLTQQILRFMNEGQEDFEPLVNFFEKVADNPQDHSREQLFNWLSKHDFTLAPDGDLIAYKGVRKTNSGDLVSISSGPAVVDGKAVNGAVPNNVGSIVEMPRSNVHHDPSVGCSTGLHVGTWNYARDFAQGAVLEVRVNPRDIVSVPTDCNWQKVRCCRYKVVKVIDVPYTTAVAFDDDDDAEDYCEDCDFNLAVEDGLCEDCLPDTEVAPTATAWDTRNNHTKQKRYPAGTYINGVNVSGRFIPKNVTV